MKVLVKSGGPQGYKTNWPHYNSSLTMPKPKIIAKQIKVIGRVQGVGYRPFVSCLAQQLNIKGWVINQGGQVEIWAEGSQENVGQFEQQLNNSAPLNAQVKQIIAETVSSQNHSQFKVLISLKTNLTNIHIPPDYNICNACLLELNTPTNCRYQYPFINCTQCGPRYTIIKQLPYDRKSTSMADFKMCESCQHEYTDISNRRYQAQILSCPHCGPTLYFHQSEQFVIGNDTALTATITTLKAGQIVAIKGIGGYHLCCLATSSAAVLKLRQKKHRQFKPFAVMVSYSDTEKLTALHHYAKPSTEELQQLIAPERPIVLIKNLINTTLAEAIAPGLNEIGFMLPYSPLHHLLLNGVSAPLIMTSANISGDPVLLIAEEVEQRLNGIADAFLHHDRPILKAAEDSVYRVIANCPQTIRLGRGSAPLELSLPFNLKKPQLAVGGQFKNTIALAWENRVVISGHIADLGSTRSQEVFESTIANLCKLYGITDYDLICDAHPDYSASRWAHQTAQVVHQVFHHYAHASALYAEHELTEDIVVFTWDGTGYAEDGSFWGGEGLFGKPSHWQRVSTFKPFRLIGGEKAALEPWRTALSTCWEIQQNWPDCPFNSDILKQAWSKNINCPLSSSVGRLFDAAAALLRLVYKADFEGHAPMSFEAIAKGKVGQVFELPLSYNETGICQSDWSPLIPLLQNTRLSQQERASSFHSSLAMSLVRQVEKIKQEKPFSGVGLTGGVFQNRLLTEQVKNSLTKAGYTVYLPKKVPANDAGLSYGQIIEVGSRD